MAASRSAIDTEESAVRLKATTVGSVITARTVAANKMLGP